MLQLELFIVENGKKERKMVKDISNYLTNNTIMVLLIKVLRKALELKSLSMETSTKENIKMVNFMEKENILGQMVHAMKVSLLME